MNIDFEILSTNVLYMLRNGADAEIKKREDTKKKQDIEDRKICLTSQCESFDGNELCSSPNCRLTCTGCDNKCY